jgi:hypothetical protein
LSHRLDSLLSRIGRSLESKYTSSNRRYKSKYSNLRRERTLRNGNDRVGGENRQNVMDTSPATATIATMMPTMAPIVRAALSVLLAPEDPEGELLVVTAGGGVGSDVSNKRESCTVGSHVKSGTAVPRSSTMNASACS